MCPQLSAYIQYSGNAKFCLNIITPQGGLKIKLKHDIYLTAAFVDRNGSSATCCRHCILEGKATDLLRIGCCVIREVYQKLSRQKSCYFGSSEFSVVYFTKISDTRLYSVGGG
jgi:hypothetical protein